MPQGSLTAAALALGVGLLLSPSPYAGGEAPPPNIVLAIGDDWSWPHAAAYGDPVVQTPAFDRIASEGVLFHNAFTATPSCTSSRATILTGQHAWRLRDAANLWGTFPAQLKVTTDLLQAAGYHVGYVGKSWGPGVLAPGGRETDPCGAPFESVASFLASRPPGAPFCLWLGPEEPHRPYLLGSGLAAGMAPQAALLPACLPDVPEVRSDLLDYYVEVEVLDQKVGAAIDAIEQLGELDNTLFVFTGDNGLPFPRCKANLYDTGTRVPLAVRWPAQVPGGRTVSDFVSLADLAPTFLEAAGLPLPGDMTARTLMPVLSSTLSGQIDPTRDRVFLARERHEPGQACTTNSYPVRALRTAGYLYVRNLRPDRWPAGVRDPSLSYRGWAFADVDPGPTKSYMIANETDPGVQPLFDLAFAQRPWEELYDLALDPDQLVNVAADPEYKAMKKQLAADLSAELFATADPHMSGGGAAFDQYSYYGPAILPDLTTDVDELDPTQPGSVTFRLSAGPAFAGMTFTLLGSASGTSPGTVYAPVLLPLNTDPYLQAILALPALFFLGSPGVLDVNGHGSVSLPFPPDGPAQGYFVPGTQLHHAYLVQDGGASYVLASNPCALDLLSPPVNYCTAGTSASGCKATLSVSGKASASAASGFTLRATGVEGGKPGLFFFGTNGRQAKPWGNGTSYQCVVPPVARAGSLAGTGTSESCEGWFTQDLNALWCAFCPKPLLNPGPGAAVQAQLWYRDPFNTSKRTTSFSDAIEFVVCR